MKCLLCACQSTWHQGRYYRHVKLGSPGLTPLGQGHTASRGRGLALQSRKWRDKKRLGDSGLMTPIVGWVPPTPRLPQRHPDWGETTTSSENSVLRRGRIQLPTFQPSAATEKGSFRLIPESLIPNLSHPPSLSTHTHSLSRTRTHILTHTHARTFIMATGPLGTDRHSGLQHELWGPWPPTGMPRRVT